MKCRNRYQKASLFNYIALLSIFIILTGCATASKPANITFCEKQQCDVVSEKTPREKILAKIFNFLIENEGRDISLIETTPETIKQQKEDISNLEKGISFFAQGGPMPGVATVKSIKITEVLFMDREKMEIKIRARPSVTWNATPMVFSSTEGSFIVKSASEIHYTNTYFGTWMVVGTSMWKHEWYIDYIDFYRRIMGGHYSIKGGGPLTVGGGSGYLVAYAGRGERIEKQEQTVALPAPPAKVQVQEQVKIPFLTMETSLKDESGNNIIDGGEEVQLNVAVENRGDGTARDVEVVLSGSAPLIKYLGEKKSLGELKKGEKKVAQFRTRLPLDVEQGLADIKIDVREASGSAATDSRVLRVAVRAKTVKETVEVLSSDVPELIFKTIFTDQNKNNIIDGGEEVQLNVAVENRGDGTARDVEVVLSGSAPLIKYLGEKKSLGELKKGEKKVAQFRTKIPVDVPSERARLKIEVKEGKGFSSFESKTLIVMMRPVEKKETEEIISEVNVDDIPLRVKNFVRQDSFAVVMGIGRYREKSIPEVKYAVRDAETITKYFERVGGIPQSNIKLLIDDKATKSDIEANLEEWLPKRVTPNSTVFIYYAGHGAPDPQGKEAYLVPYEGNPDYLTRLYPLTKLYETLGRLKAKEVIVMLDSCFSGAKGRSLMPEGARPMVMSIKSPIISDGKIIVLAGSEGNQISSDYDKVKHGLFTYYLLRGLRGEADENGNGLIEVGELYQYTRKNVSEKASLEFNREQTPILLPTDSISRQMLNALISKTR